MSDHNKTATGRINIWLLKGRSLFKAVYLAKRQISVLTLLVIIITTACLNTIGHVMSAKKQAGAASIATTAASFAGCSDANSIRQQITQQLTILSFPRPQYFPQIYIPFTRGLYRQAYNELYITAGRLGDISLVSLHLAIVSLNQNNSTEACKLLRQAQQATSLMTEADSKAVDIWLNELNDIESLLKTIRSWSETITVVGVKLLAGPAGPALSVALNLAYIGIDWAVDSSVDGETAANKELVENLVVLVASEVIGNAKIPGLGKSITVDKWLENGLRPSVQSSFLTKLLKQGIKASGGNLTPALGRIINTVFADSISQAAKDSLLHKLLDALNQASQTLDGQSPSSLTPGSTLDLLSFPVETTTGLLDPNNPLQIVDSSPGDAAHYVGTGLSSISVTFSDSVQPGNMGLVLSDSNGGNIPLFNGGIVGDTLTFSVGGALGARSSYSATLSAGAVIDSTGSGNSAYTWSFVTAAPALSVGASVDVSNTSNRGLSLRSSASTNASLVSLLSENTRMLIIGGPVTGEGYTWWNLSGNGVSGWGATGDWLTPNSPDGMLIRSDVTVAHTGGIGLHLRDNPGLDGQIVTTLQDGTVMTIIGGPYYVDGYLWWNVKGPSQSGFSAVAYWLQPEASGANPTVRIESPTGSANYQTNSSTISLSGVAYGNSSIAAVTWGTSFGSSGFATGTLNWQTGAIPLQSGSNAIAIVARDQAGHIGQATLTVQYTPPSLGSCGNGTSVNYRINNGPPTHPDGTLILDQNGSTVYLLQGGKRRGITTPTVLNNLYAQTTGKFDFKDVIRVSTDEFNQYQEGNVINSTLPSNGKSQADGRLIRRPGGAEVSIVTGNGRRRPFTNESAFLGLGYLFCNVVDASDYDTYPADVPADAAAALTFSSILPGLLVGKDWGESITYDFVVTDLVGNPVSGVSVGGGDNLRGIVFLATSSTDSNGRGSYTTTVPANSLNGTYDIIFIAEKSGYASSQGVTRQVNVNHIPMFITITAIDPVANQILDWGASVTYAISVKGANNLPISGATITATDDVAAITAQSLPLTDSQGRTTYTTTVPNGKQEGVYGLTFKGSKAGYPNTAQVVRQITVNHVDLGSGSVDFAWKFKQNMPAARSNSAVAVYNNKIYIIAGNDDSKIYVYDPAADSWEQKTGPFGHGISEGGAAVIGSKIYAIGNPVDMQMRIYDPINDQWGNGSTMSTQIHRGPSVAGVEGKMYVIGGGDTNLNGLGDVRVYDPTNDAWSDRAPMNTRRGFAASAVLNNRIFVMGGLDFSTSPTTKNQVEVYDTHTNSWSNKSPMPVATYIAGSAVINGKIYVIGGFNGNFPLGVVQEYNPDTDFWKVLPSSIQTARDQGMVTAVNSKIYVIGGNNQNGPLSSVEEGTPFQIPDNTLPRVTITSPVSTPTFETTSSVVSLQGKSSDDVGVSNVTWTNDRGGSGSANGTMDWSVSNIMLQAGPNLITVIARDAAGNSGTATLTVTYSLADTISPTNVVITSPGNGQTLSGTVTLKATALDNSGSIQKLQFFIGNGSSPICADNSPKASGSVFQCGFNTQQIPNGNYVVKARAFDFGGNAADSAGTTINVNNISATCSYDAISTINNISHARRLGIKGNKLYVSSLGRFYVIDTTTNTLVASVPFSPYPNSMASDMAFVGNTAYVTLSNLFPTDQIAIIDTTTDSVTGYMPVSVSPEGMKAYNGKLYVAHSIWWSNGSPSTVDVIDPATKSVIKSINTGVQTFDIAIADTVNKGYAINYVSSDVTIIDLGSNSAIGTIALPVNPKAVSFNAGKVYVVGTLPSSQTGQLVVIDPVTNSIVNQIFIGRDPKAVAESGNRIYVLNNSDRNMTILSSDTFALLSTLSVGFDPFAIAIDPSNSNVYVANESTGIISVVGCDPNISITVGTSLPGLQFKVDGTSYTSSQTFGWKSGSTHTISTNSPQGGSTTRNIWTNWDDGGVIEHTVSPTASATYTANFKTQYFVQLSATAGGTAAPTSDWYNKGDVVSISAVPNSSYSFIGWQGGGSGSYTGANVNSSIIVNEPITEIAQFVKNTISLSVNSLTIPSGGSNAVQITISPVQGIATSIGLSSSNSAVASVPSSITVPAGSASTSFSVSGLSPGGPVTVTASLPQPLGGISAAVTVSVIGCPTVTDISPSSGQPGNTVGITGSNFTGVSAINFGNNVMAAFSIDNGGHVTATVPSIAVTGPIVISKAQCSDVQTGIFTVTQAGSGTPTNVALASSGATAFSSSVYSGSYPANLVINGDHKGVNGYWADGNPNIFPDWVEVDFNGPKTISEIDVYTLQDNLSNLVEPTSAITFSKYGVTAFDVQYWNGTAWITIPNGSVTNNNLVWRKLSFTTITTSKIRVLINSSKDGYSRLVEIEAYQSPAPVLPTVTLTSPLSGTTFAEPATINISASASESGGSIAMVEFFNGTTKLAQSTTSPYSFTWSGVSAGTYGLQAVATDSQGFTATSDQATIVVSPGSGGGPAVNVASASNGATAIASSVYNGNYPASLVIDGDHKGVNGYWADGNPNIFPDWVEVDFNGPKTIGEIDVYTLQDNLSNPVDPTLATTFSKYGITAFSVQYWDGITWVTIPNGSLTNNNQVLQKFGFAAVTTNKIRVLVSGSKDGYSRLVEIEAYQAPVGLTVNLTSPANGATFAAPATINLSATASGAGGIAKVEFLNGAAKIGEAIAAPYNFSWPNVPAGNYVLLAIATDGSGKTAISDSVNVTVGQRINVAQASNGATAIASSVYSGSYPAGALINGDRKGPSGYWADATRNVFPDSVEIVFNGNKTLNEIDVYTLQDSLSNPVDPTLSTTFTQYGVTAFDVQYWDGIAWVPIPNGSVTNNNLVWRSFSFAPITTNKIRVLINGSQDGYSRLVEIEAYQVPGTPTPTNVASASNGATAFASSIYSGSYLATAAIDGDHKGVSGYWADATPGVFPDWVEVDFNGPKTIGEIDVYTLQDNLSSPVEPTLTTTFSKYGITGFSVQYWDGITWVTITSGSVANNSLVWSKFTFTAITTNKIRVLVNASKDGYSRVVEVEAYTSP